MDNDLALLGLRGRVQNIVQTIEYTDEEGSGCYEEFYDVTDGLFEDMFCEHELWYFSYTLFKYLDFWNVEFNEDGNMTYRSLFGFTEDFTYNDAGLEEEQIKYAGYYTPAPQWLDNARWSVTYNGSSIAQVYFGNDESGMFITYDYSDDNWTYSETSGGDRKDIVRFSFMPNGQIQEVQWETKLQREACSMSNTLLEVRFLYEDEMLQSTQTIWDGHILSDISFVYQDFDEHGNWLSREAKVKRYRDGETKERTYKFTRSIIYYD